MAVERRMRKRMDRGEDVGEEEDVCDSRIRLAVRLLRKSMSDGFGNGKWIEIGKEEDNSSVNDLSCHHHHYACTWSHCF